MSRVALTACASYEPDALEPALDALLAGVNGLPSYVRAGQTVVLKPNLISAERPARAATTHPAVLRALARRVLALGARPVIADAPAWGGPLQVAEHTGVGAVCAELGLEFWYLDRHCRVPSARPGVAAGFHIDPRIRDADVLINVGKLKAHQQLGFTAAQKNLYGCLAGREKAWHHLARSRHDAEFARYLATFAASLPVALNVIDGVLAMEGMGPRLGRPRPLGVLLAGVDAVAVDAVVAELIGAPPSHRLMLDAAAALGLGESSLEAIELVGDPLAALAVSDFVFPTLIGVGFSPWRLVRGWLRNKRLQAADRRAAA